MAPCPCLGKLLTLGRALTLGELLRKEASPSIEVKISATQHRWGPLLLPSSLLPMAVGPLGPSDLLQDFPGCPDVTWMKWREESTS